MAVPFNALLIADDVTREMQNAFSGYDSSDTNTILVVEGLIQEVTEIMEGLLNRNLIVRKHQEYYNYCDWDASESRSKYYVVPSRYPIVEIDTSGFTIGRQKVSREDDIILYSTRYSGAIVYYAGYKRSEQVIGDLTAESELADLGTLPSNLPYDIRNVALSGVLHGLAERNQGPGQRSRTINPAIQSVTVTEPLRDYLQRIILERIPHRRVL